MTATLAAALGGPAPALSSEVQEIANWAAQAGLCPLVRDVDEDIPQFEVAFLPNASADPDRDAEWLLVVDLFDQTADLALYGPGEDPDSDGRVWLGVDRVLHLMEDLAYARSFALAALDPTP